MNPEVIVLVYHVVSDEILPHVVHLYPYKTPAEFTLDLEYLHANYHILSLQEFERGRKPGVLLTFDDGFAECYDVVRPILLRLGIPCTFFVTTSFIDNQRLFYRHKVSLCIERMKQMGRVDEELTQWVLGLKHADEHAIDSVCERAGVDSRKFLRERRPYLTTRQLEQLVADGFTLGGHGRHHAELAELGDPALIEAEIIESCEHVRRITGTTRVPFAFPFTGRRVNRELLREIIRRNTSVSFLFDIAGLPAGVPVVDRIVNRIGADRPAATGAAGSALPALLQHALASLP